MTSGRFFLLLVGLIILRSASPAQADTSGNRHDSTAARAAGPTPPGAVIEGFHPTKSSLLAVGLSLVFPGTGQIYNEDYWKAPVIWTLAGYWVYEHVKNNKTYNDFSGRYFSSITPAIPEGNPQLKTLRDFYRDERDKFAWYLGALYALNLLDAYVSANLYDFTVTPDLSLDGRMGRKVTASLRLRF